MWVKMTSIIVLEKIDLVVTTKVIILHRGEAMYISLIGFR